MLHPCYCLIRLACRQVFSQVKHVYSGVVCEAWCGKVGLLVDGVSSGDTGVCGVMLDMPPYVPCVAKIVMRVNWAGCMLFRRLLHAVQAPTLVQLWQSS